jgi:hypothetical protein
MHQSRDSLAGSGAKMMGSTRQKARNRCTQSRRECRDHSLNFFFQARGYLPAISVDI